MSDFGVLNALRWLENWWTLNYALCWLLAPLMLFRSKDAESTTLEIKLFMRRLWTLLIIAPPAAALLMLLIIAATRDKAAEALIGGWFDKYLWRILLTSPAALLGFGARVAFDRWLVPKLSALKRQSVKEQKTDKLTDIKTEWQKYPSKTFDPREHFRDDALFLGLTEKDEPIHIPWDLFYGNGQQVIGPSQRGKGVLFQIQAAQLIKKGDFVCYLAPKLEKFMEQILWTYAKEYGRKFHLIDLSDDGPGFWHPFTEGTREEQEECLIAGLSLGDAGDSKSNHYRQEDLAAIFASKPGSFRIADILAALEKADPENRERAVYRELTMWSRIRSLSYGSPAESFSLDQALLDGAVVYVRGSLSNERIIKAMAAFMKLVRLRAAALQRKRTNHATMFIDEASVLVSEELRLTPAASLSGGLNVCIAYQSYLDLTKGLGGEGKAFIVSVNNNCQIKIIYGTVDHDTKLWAAGMTGKTTKNVVTQERTVINTAGGEAWDDSRLVTTQQVPLHEENTIQSLNPRVGLLILPGGKPAEIIFTAYLNADRTEYDKWLDAATAAHQTRLAEIERQLSGGQVQGTTAQAGPAVPPAFP